MNAALFVDAWHPDAPPEILCREVESTVVALRRLKNAWRKYTFGVDCDGEKYHGESTEEIDDWSRPLPSWLDLHRAVWTGSFCSHTRDQDFIARAREAELDPHAAVTWEMLGETVPVESQDEVAHEIQALLDLLPKMHTQK